MVGLLWVVPALPLAGSVALILFGSRVSRRVVAVIASGAVGLSALVSLLIAVSYIRLPVGSTLRQVLWPWVAVGGFKTEIALYLDALSLVMILVVTFVGFLIHVYSTEFMIEDAGYSRFFVYMNLFVASMVVLVLADNLLLLYLGWEGVGLCSFLLIGFWYQEASNTVAARKAFIVTRVGDTAMAIGLFLLFHQLGTLDIQELMKEAINRWTPGSGVAVAAAALLLGGAVGKSAQLPLQTWLPDAMAGPTPTSALIHAATMVTAGVYLIARTNVLFSLAPSVQLAVAVIGIATLLMAGFSALTQPDIKRILAYSTVSQIGYMFLALGVGAWGAAMFHFMTHAFFKALLFLAAGIVIEALHHEHNIFRMGGVRRELPFAFWLFVIGGSALAGVPVLTSGFYSKDLILWETAASPLGGTLLWALAIGGVLLTALYTFRLIFVVFCGEPQAHVSRRPGMAMRAPVAVLALLSIIGGFINLPPTLGDFRMFEHFIHRALPETTLNHAGPISEGLSAITATAAVALGIYLAFFFFVRRSRIDSLAKAGLAQSLHRFWGAGWGFDWLYGRLFVRPVLVLARINRGDFVDSIYTGLARTVRWMYGLLSLTQTGRLRWYAAGVAAGSVLLIAIVLLV
jgi:NADH-quinone oxidoreductase subunit L